MHTLCIFCLQEPVITRAYHSFGDCTHRNLYATELRSDDLSVGSDDTFRFIALLLIKYLPL